MTILLRYRILEFRALMWVIRRLMTRAERLAWLEGSANKTHRQSSGKFAGK
jgi:hypothetical protein